MKCPTREYDARQLRFARHDIKVLPSGSVVVSRRAVGYRMAKSEVSLSDRSRVQLCLPTAELIGSLAVVRSFWLQLLYEALALAIGCRSYQACYAVNE